MMDCKWADLPPKCSILRVRVTSGLCCPPGQALLREQDCRRASLLIACPLRGFGLGFPLPSVFLPQVGSAHGGLQHRLTLLWSVKVWVSLSHPFIKCFLLELGRAADEVGEKNSALTSPKRTGQQMPPTPLVDNSGGGLCVALTCAVPSQCSLREQAPLHSLAVPWGCLLLYIVTVN